MFGAKILEIYDNSMSATFRNFHFSLIFTHKETVTGIF